MARQGDGDDDSGLCFQPHRRIPDFIPVLGYLDELVILPLFIWLTIRLVPPDIMAELRAEADRRLSDSRPRNMTGAVVIILIWLSMIALAVYWLLL